MEKTKNHWEQIYKKKKSDELSWYQNEAVTSLKFIEKTGINLDDWIIDVGGGESNLVDSLRRKNFKNIAILDISANAIQQSKLRLGSQASKVEWHESDITTFKPPHQYSLWHDRAVFHFLTSELDRKNYLKTLETSLGPKGHFILATFTPNGPKQCSGIEIVQYDEEALLRFFGAAFVLKKSKIEIHVTPWRSEQEFIYTYFQKKQI